MRGRRWAHEACLMVLGLVISAAFASPAWADDEERVNPNPTWVYHPGNAVTFDVGLFGGGADLASSKASNGSTIDTISFGSGTEVTIGGMVTPLWIGEYAGFGAGGFAG